MKLLHIRIESFRNFSGVEFAFSERFTLISGSHGAGKTSLLDACAEELSKSPDAGVRAYYSSMSANAPDGTLAPGNPLLAAEPLRNDAVRQAMSMVASVEQSDAGYSYAGGAPRPWAQLSDGPRRLAATAADLAARGADGMPGVVLIDDIEAGLHPNCQRRLIEDLQRAFPMMQFIASTYSPFIIQSLDGGVLIDLDNNTPADFPHLSIEDITETILGIDLPQRSKRYRDMKAAADEYVKLLAASDAADSLEKRRLKARLDELMMPFSNNQAFCAVLEAERLESGIDDEE